MEDQSEKPICYSFCFSSFLYNNYQTCRDRTLIIDTRDKEDYNRRHVKGSISLTNKRIQDYVEAQSSVHDKSQLSISDISGMLQKHEASKFANRKRCFCFIVLSESSLPKNFISELKRASGIDDKEDSFRLHERNVKSSIERLIGELEEPESVLNALTIYKLLHRDRLRELYLVLDGGKRFFARYPYMVTTTHSIADLTMGSKSVSAPVDCDYPHDILDGRLFLGSFNQSEKASVVSGLKITHILNITSECGNVHEDKGVKYLKISILDEDDKNIHAHFQNVYQFIEETLEQDENNNILIHCALGKSRSATVTIMYLMKRFSWSFDKAFAFVKAKREIIDPNDGFVQQLRDFESDHFAFISSSTTQKQYSSDV